MQVNRLPLVLGIHWPRRLAQFGNGTPSACVKRHNLGHVITETSSRASHPPHLPLPRNIPGIAAVRIRRPMGFYHYCRITLLIVRIELPPRSWRMWSWLALRVRIISPALGRFRFTLLNVDAIKRHIGGKHRDNEIHLYSRYSRPVGIHDANPTAYGPTWFHHAKLHGKGLTLTGDSNRRSRGRMVCREPDWVAPCVIQFSRAR